MGQDPKMRRFDAVAAGGIADRLGGCSDRIRRGNMGGELRMAVYFGLGAGVGWIPRTCQRVFRLDHRDIPRSDGISDLGSFNSAAGPITEGAVLP